MSSLVIDRRGVSIKADAGALVIRTAEDQVRSVPISGLSRLVVCHSVELDTSTLGILQAQGVAVIAINHRISKHSFNIFQYGGFHCERRLKQLALYFNPAVRQQLALEVVRQKLAIQCAWLSHQADKHARLRHQCLTALEKLDALLNNQLKYPCSLDQLRGYEGAAQKAWFQCLSHCLPSSLGFTKRQRRPPSDAVNACLSFAYMRIYFETIAVINTSVLDASIGFYHLAKDRRASLACDLMEPIRPLVDGLICALFNRQQLRGRHFKLEGKRCHIGSAGRLLLAEALEKSLPDWRRRLTKSCGTLSKIIDKQPLAAT